MRHLFVNMNVIVFNDGRIKKYEKGIFIERLITERTWSAHGLASIWRTHRTMTMTTILTSTRITTMEERSARTGLGARAAQR